MRRLTTIILAVAFMIAGVSAAFMDYSPPSNKTMMAATMPEPLQWNVTGKLPLDLQLDLEERLSHEPCIKDSINIIDSVRIINKVRWKTRYKDVADRTTAREVGTHPMAVIPDSMSKNPTIISTLDREEQPSEVAGVSKTPSIQLTVDGEVVYSRDDNHSAEGCQ